MGEFYAPPGRVRSIAFLKDDADDKQADALLELANALTQAETAQNWAIVGDVNVALRTIARGLAAKDESEG